MVGLYRLFAVGIIAAVVFVAFLGLLFRALLRMFGVKVGTPMAALSPMRRRLRIALVLTGAAGVLAVPWAFIEPYFPRVETVRIPSWKITRPVRIVQLSDLHCDRKQRAEPRILEKVRALKPDLIAFTGDGVNGNRGIPVFRRTMKALSEIAPLFGVRGNWEVWWFTHVDTFEGTGIEALDGTARPIRLAGQTLWIGGTAVDNEGAMKQVLRRMPKAAFRIVLHHFPAANRLVDGRADLLLSGDTHGGQIVLPFIGPLVRVTRWDRIFYASGLHHTAKGLWFYVNRGVGMEGRAAPRIRFNCPPEITLITLVPGKGEGPSTRTAAQNR